jgi:hypothetical protein
MTAPANPRASLGGLPEAWMNLLRAQMQVGSELYQSLTGQPPPSLADLARELGVRGSRRTGATCCTIPAPCWMPRSLGHCTSNVSVCKSACIELAISNCDRVRRTIAVEATGSHAGKVTIEPPSITLGPMEHGTVRVCLATPESAKVGETLESLLWVRGCQEQFLRWTVGIGTLGIDSCHRIEISDCPDYLHHWYDHFYCGRGCLHRD